MNTGRKFSAPRQKGCDVRFLTGTDEHGQKVQAAAEKRGVAPQDLVDRIHLNFKELWRVLNISNDDFIRTTEDRHVKVVQEIFRRIYEKGDIYKGEYKGLYCTPCEAYWTEHQLKDGQCPDCGRPVEEVAEEAYFFKMSHYADQLLSHIESHPDFIQPTSRRNEMINFIRQGLDDLCISRTSFDWGIPIPTDKKHVIYVWFDALTNYLTPVGFLSDPKKFHRYWPADLHLVGKEIVRFHSIIWPAILMALDLPLPKQIYGHGWLIVNGDKMSKSKGNVVDPNLLIDEFGADAIRYFLLREINLGQDGNFSRDALISRINADLANDLGNLLHRTLNMIGKFQGGIIEGSASKRPVDEALVADAMDTVSTYEAEMEKLALTPAVKTVWAFIGRANKYIDETAPWALAKDPSKKAELAAVLYHLAESLRIISGLISPFLPQTAPKIRQQLGCVDALAAPSLDDLKIWGRLPAGQKIGAAEPLFPRIETEEGSTAPTPPAAKLHAPQTKKTVAESAEITIDEFSKIHLRVVKILSAEKVPETDKLLKLRVDLGSEEREIVSGISQHYTPEQLIGKTVVMVVNLKPTKIRGILSQGMVLAASQGDQLKLLGVDMPVGSQIR